MNKGFSYYFRNGMSLAAHALKGESFSKRFTLLVYFLMSFIGKLFFFTRPIFAIADMNLANMVRECRSFSFAKIFQNTADGKRYKNLLLFYFVIDFFLLVGLILILLPIIILWSIVGMSGLDPSSMDYAVIYWITFMLTIILSIGFAIFACVVILTYIPAGYIASSTRRLDVSDYLYNCKKAMNGVKWTHFLVQLVYFVIIGAIVGAVVGAIIALMLFSEYYLGMILATLMILASTILLIYIVEIFFLGSLNSSFLVCKYATSLDHVAVVTDTIDDEDKVQVVIDEENEPGEAVEETTKDN